MLEDGHNEGETLVLFLLSPAPFKSILHNTLFFLFWFFFFLQTMVEFLTVEMKTLKIDTFVCSRRLRDGGRDGDLGAGGVRDRETLKVNLELHKELADNK